MRFQRFGTFTGGLDLPEEKSATCDRAILAIPRPMRLMVPLDPCRLGEAIATVVPGQHVKANERIGTAGGRMPIYAPLGGTVAALTQTVLPSSSPEGRPCPAVELTDLTPVRDFPRPPTEFRWQDVEDKALLQRIGEGGLTTMAEPLTPLADVIRACRTAQVDTLIANGMENQPYLTSCHRIMAECGREIIEALAMLGRLMGARRVVLAVDHRRTNEYRAMEKPARRLGVSLLALAHKYPTGHSNMLTLLLARREVPIGKTPLDVRVAVIQPSACLAAYRCLALGEPCTDRVVTVCGEGVGSAGNYCVPFGTPAAHVLAECDAPVGASHLCCGGPMTGGCLPPGAVLSPAGDSLLVLPEEEHTPPSACIRCGWCTDHCPVRLNVAFLNDLYELGQAAKALRRGVRACLGCGVCSYVCPARLPLRHRMVQLKTAANDLVQGRQRQKA